MRRVVPRIPVVHQMLALAAFSTAYKSGGLAAAGADMTATGIPDSPLTAEQWAALAPEIDASVERVRREQARHNGAEVLAAAPATTSWPPPLDLAALATREPEAPRSIMEGVPIGYATGTFGHGGAGKSQIELMRAVCIAAGVPFCGFEVQRRRVMFLSCEDRADVLHWRLTRICRHLGVSLASLRGWMEVVDLVGFDALLYATDPRTGYSITSAYGVLAERIRQHGTEMLIVDGIADTYGDSENARGPVKRFINSMLALIPPATGALILVGHVNRMTAANAQTSEGYSGSTSWHNSCRARWYLYPQTDEDEDGQRCQRTGKLIFELQKSNHGEVGTQIEFSWDNDAHLFIGQTTGLSHFDRMQQQREEQRDILLALRDCTQASITVPAATTGQRTAYHVLMAQTAFPDSLRSGKPSVRRFWREIEALRAMRYVRDDSIRRADRHYTATLTLTPEGLRACG